MTTKNQSRNVTRGYAERLTLGVEGLDDILARLASHSVQHEPVETYGNGVRTSSFSTPTETASRSARLLPNRASVSSVAD